MLVTTKSGRKLILPTPEEDARINAGIAADPDTYELSDAEFKRLRSVGRPRAEVTKERITIRLSPEVLRPFRNSGEGWQTRMDAALADWLKTHSPKTGKRRPQRAAD
ncbi:MAG: BrnA antitoxin family protein [Rudaea sp.]|uniref:BrnA antitoxin family protein n=1 Tax=Rudaea sp. TaxID=2136325 RepID=UPI0039E4DECC